MGSSSSSSSGAGRWVAKRASSQGWASLEKGRVSVRGGSVDLRGIVATASELVSAEICRDFILARNSSSSCRGARPLSGIVLNVEFADGLHHANRLTISSHSSKLMNSSSATFVWPSGESCCSIFGSKELANNLRISCPNSLVALMDLRLNTSRNSYIPVTIVSFQPISTTTAARRPAATVVSAGAECKDIFGDWKFVKMVSNIVERSGDGSVEGRARVTFLGLESMSRYLHTIVSIVIPIPILGELLQTLYKHL